MVLSIQLMEFSTGKRSLQDNRLGFADHKWHHMGVAVIRKHENELGGSTRILKDGSVPTIED
jgi:hypothetical protein